MAFNPIKVEKDDSKAHRIVWTTEALNKAIDGLGKGQKLLANPFYENDVKLLKSDLLYQRTPAEMAHFKACMGDILLFCRECQLMTPKGIQHVTLRDYQEEYLKHLEANRLSIFLSARQSGKTTTSALFILWFACMNFDKNCLVLGNKYKTAKEILDKIKNIFIYLPFHLRPGVKKWNESEIVFDNGCRIMAEATTINSGISFTFHCVLSDEFAHIAPNIVEKFYMNIFPTITAGNARFIISSTQNGFNLFHKLYKGAESGDNDYAPFRVDWHQIPEWNPITEEWDKRDEKWKRRQTANLGGEEAFNMQFGTTFEVSGKTLISVKHIKRMQREAKNFKQIEMFDGNDWWFHPDIEDPYEFKKWFLLFTIDIAEGGGGDDSVINIARLEDRGEDKVGQRHIARYTSNEVSVDILAQKLINFVSMYCICDNILVSYELNTYGALFKKNLFTYAEDINETSPHFKNIRNNWDESVIVKYDKKPGYKMTSTSKREACMMLKYAIEKEIYINEDVMFVSQSENFEDVKDNGSYEASFGRDDIIMSAVQIGPLTQVTTQYKLLEEEFMTNVDMGDTSYTADIYESVGAYYGGTEESVWGF